MNRVPWRAYLEVAEAICQLAEAREPGDDARELLTGIAFDVATRAAGAYMERDEMRAYADAMERMGNRIGELSRTVEQWRRDKSRDPS